MSGMLLKTKYVSAVRSDGENGLILLLANRPGSQEGERIEQVASTESYRVFEAHGKMTIDQHNVLDQVQIRCIQDINRFLIPTKEYYSLIREINKRDQEAFNTPIIPTPTHSRYIKDYHDESDNEGLGHRGRGRPKGSKNKKTLVKEVTNSNRDPSVYLKNALNNRIKRGKGRPKGSKNKIKLLNRHQFREPFGDETESMPLGKRGKGRPKGSKNKIKVPLAMGGQSNEDENGDNKRKGRPVGVRNRLNSNGSHSQQHQFSNEDPPLQLIRPCSQDIQSILCCQTCTQRKLKTQILTGQVVLEDKLQTLCNIQQNLGPQYKVNLLLKAIQLNNSSLFSALLQVVNQQQSPYASPWPAGHYIEQTAYNVRTKRDYLQRGGTQDPYTLLHDGVIRRLPWWKQLSIEVILSSLSREDPCNIIVLLLQHSPQLQQQVYDHIATVVRSGNLAAAQAILTYVLNNNKNHYCFSEEHLDLLMGHPEKLNSFKKSTITAANKGEDYLSPIHCAAVCPNADFFRKLLSVFTDVLHVQDSLGRKPIHYAAVAAEVYNLVILVEEGAQLKEYDHSRKTPLMLACAQGLTNNVQYILERVRDTGYINIKSNQGYNALHYAVLHNHLECFELLLNDPLVKKWALTESKEDVFHLLAGTGRIDLLQLVFRKEMLPYDSQDKFKRTPAMVAVRNHHNQFLCRLLQEGCKHERLDSSLNSLLHYAAAYGNAEAILILLPLLSQSENKRTFTPWQLSVAKGHLGCAQLLQGSGIEQSEDIMSLVLGAIRGTDDYLNCVKYIGKFLPQGVNYRNKVTGNGYLHQVCSLGEDEYVKARKEESSELEEEIRDQYSWVQENLIDYFVAVGSSREAENKKGETPFQLCIENMNLVGFQKLLPQKINLQIQCSSENTLAYCLIHLACKGINQMKFVQKKIKEQDKNQFKIYCKKYDHNGYDFLQLFVKIFVQHAVDNFNRLMKLKSKVPNRKQKPNQPSQQCKGAINEFIQFQQKFIQVCKWLIVDIGCDCNTKVQDRKTQQSDKYKKWGIQHFLMTFPSMRLISFFKNYLKDLNSLTSQNQTPLHLFLKNIHTLSLLHLPLPHTPVQYQTTACLQLYLQKGGNPNKEDSNKLLPILFTAIYPCFQFMKLLLTYKSAVNFCTTKNNILLIEVIKRRLHFNTQHIEYLLQHKTDPNFVDMDERNALHHLIHSYQPFDNSAQVCQLLLRYNANVNALDIHGRSPIFYCFIPVSSLQRQNANEDGEKIVSRSIKESVQLLQILASCKGIDVNLKDTCNRGIVHYACQGNYYFSLLYMLKSMQEIDWEAKDGDGNTPFALCLINNRVEQVCLLIKKKVRNGEVHAQHSTKTYYQYAVEKKLSAICLLLNQQGYGSKNKK